MICAPGETVLFRDLAVNQRFDPDDDSRKIDFPFIKTSPRRWLRVNGDAATVETILFTVTAGPMDSAIAARAAAQRMIRR